MLIQARETLVSTANFLTFVKPENVEQGALVNGSVGKVVDFMTTRQALERHIEIAQLVNRERPKTAATAPEIPQLVPESNLCPLGDTVFGQHQAWPMVRFTNGRELLCAPLAFTVEGFMGNVEARRLQVPLILAWALSIHKSQGQTLSRVKVDLSRIFEKGQGERLLSHSESIFLSYVIISQLMSRYHAQQLWNVLKSRTSIR